MTLLARIEIRHTRDDGYVASMWRGALLQECRPDRYGAIDAATRWCLDCWAEGIDVELAEYDIDGALRWSARGLRSVGDLQRHVAGLQAVRVRAEAAARESAA